MRIHDRNLTGAAGMEAGRAQETQRSGQTAESSHPVTSREGDRVEFSEGLGRLSQVLAEHRSGHAAKVQALAASYRAETYGADARASSRGMIEDALGAKDTG